MLWLSFNITYPPSICPQYDNDESNPTISRHANLTDSGLAQNTQMKLNLQQTCGKRQKNRKCYFTTQKFIMKHATLV